MLPEKGSIVKEEGDAEGKFVVGAYAERKEDGANAKFYWFSTYSVMDVKNTLQYYGNPYLFLGLLVNTCQIQYPTVDPTVLSVEYLTVSAGSATLWGWILIALIPVGVFGGGFLVWQLRRTR